MAQAFAPTTPAERINVPIWAWFAVAVLVLGMYLITMENGAFLGHAAETSHEFFHDARHFIGVPCH